MLIILTSLILDKKPLLTTRSGMNFLLDMLLTLQKIPMTYGGPKRFFFWIDFKFAFFAKKCLFFKVKDTFKISHVSMVFTISPQPHVIAQ